MISDEEIKLIAVETKSFELNEEFITFWGIDATEEVMAFAREIERISRQQQRESDAELCRAERITPVPGCVDDVAYNLALGHAEHAILANKEQP